MATMCPKCGKESLKKGRKMVYCAGYKPVKNGDIVGQTRELASLEYCLTKKGFWKNNRAKRG